MEIILNGEKETVPAGLTVARLLAQLELNPDIVTVQVNGTGLNRQELAGTVLQEGDKVEVILFMGGGI